MTRPDWRMWRVVEARLIVAGEELLLFVYTDPSGSGASSVLIVGRDASSADGSALRLMRSESLGEFSSEQLAKEAAETYLERREKRATMRP